jgi:ATP-dependent protease ClpP protease subunit
MAKELYLYSGIYSFTAESLIAAMEENKSEDITLRLNSPGGSVPAGWGIIAKMIEHGNVSIKVDGVAASMGAMLLPFAQNVTVLDVTKIMLHKADMMVESPEDQKFLDDVNKDLLKALTKKIDNTKLKELKGIGLSELFASGERKDMWLSAKEAKDIGLVDKITKLTPQEAKAFDEKFYSIAATAEPKIIQPIKTENKMTVAEFKAAHPDVFASVVQLGIDQEKDRVSACLVFNEIDPKGVKEAIESGKPLSQTQMAQFSLKAASAQSLKKIISDNATTIIADAGDGKVLTDEEKEIAAFKAKIDANMKKIGAVKDAGEGKFTATK